MLRPLTLLLFVLVHLLPAQTIDTLGGTASAPSGGNRAKGSLFAVDQSVVLIDFEMHLNVPAPETLTWFCYRHHSRTGTASLLWTTQTVVPGGIGPSWYSTGPIALPLVAGNHYVLGVSWAGTITYYYSTGTTGTPTSFGSWQRAHTLNNPLPTTLTIPAGVDVAVYYTRLTTVPVSSVVNTGTPCSGTALLPRLVAGNFFTQGNTTALELVDTAAAAITVLGLGAGGAAAVPLPLFGCSIWLDVSQPIVTLAQLASPAGYSSLPLAIPANPLLSGTTWSSQGLVFGASVDVANAVSFTIQ